MKVIISMIEMRDIELAKFLNGYLDYMNSYCCTEHFGGHIWSLNIIYICVSIKIP